MHIQQQTAYGTGMFFVATLAATVTEKLNWKTKCRETVHVDNLVSKAIGKIGRAPQSATLQMLLCRTISSSKTAKGIKKKHSQQGAGCPQPRLRSATALMRAFTLPYYPHLPCSAYSWNRAVVDCLHIAHGKPH